MGISPKLTQKYSVLPRLLQIFAQVAQTCTRVSTRIQVQLFGRKLLPFISPRSVEQKRVGVDAPPLGMLPDDFRGCPWYPSASGFGFVSNRQF